MPTKMGFIKLPITRYSVQMTNTKTEITRLFGFGDWIDSQPQKKLFISHPNILLDLTQEFNLMFKEPNILDLRKFCFFGFNLKLKYRRELADTISEASTLNPFSRGYFESSTHVSVFYYLFNILKPMIKPIPTVINTVQIQLGSLRSAAVIELDTLNRMDINSSYSKIDFSMDEDFKGTESYAHDIYNELGNAKEEQKDFFVYLS